MRSITKDDLRDGTLLLCVLDEDEDVCSWVGKTCYVDGNASGGKFQLNTNDGCDLPHGWFSLSAMNGLDAYDGLHKAKFVLYDEISGKDKMKYKMTGKMDHLL